MLKKLFPVILLVLVGMLVIGCGPADQAATDDEMVVGLAISTLDNPFFVDLKEGAEEAAEELGIVLIIADGRNDTNVQFSDIEDFIAREVDVIIVNPVDSEAIVPVVEAVNEAGIPVITVDRGAADGEIISHIASDNIAGGKMAGEHIIDLTGGSGKVVELEGIPGTSAARERGEGFNAAMDAVAGITVIARHEAGFDRAKGMSVMEDILEAHPEIDAVFAHNDEMALGALKAIQAAGRADEIIVVGFDATNCAVDAVKEGSMAATVAQKPRSMGQIALETAKEVLDGRSVEKYIPVDLVLVTK